MMTESLNVIDITKHFSQGSSSLSILENTSFQFHSATSYALMGPSGIGKSTLLHILAGLEQPSSGAITLNGTKLYDTKKQQKTTTLFKGINLIFQNPCLINELSVLENVMLTAIAQNIISKETTKHAQNLLSATGLELFANHAPNTLSGGQQQRVAILRAIFQPPMFLLADEPTGNLDEETAQQIITLLKVYQKKYNMGLIISTHDEKIANQCDIILHIDNKTILLKK